MTRDSELLIVDACVLIDFCDTDRTVLTAVCGCIGQIHVASTTLAKVDQLDAAEAESLGVRVVVPEVGMLEEVAEVRRAGIALDDAVCLRLAHDHDWTCVTNDRRLRKACDAEAVRTMWGLEMLLRLAQVGGITEAEARAVGESIAEKNKLIGEKVLRDFQRKLRTVRKKQKQ